MAFIDSFRGKWRVRWREGGKSRSKTCANKREAERLLADVERGLHRPRTEPRRSRALPLLKEVFAAYIRDRALTRAPRTIERYGINLDIFLRWLREVEQNGEPLYVSLLSKSLLVDYYRSLATGGRWGKGRNLDTRRRMALDVKLAWEWAHDDEHLGPSVPRPPRKLEFPSEPGKPTVAPTWEEMDRAIAASSGWHCQLAIVLRFTGLRVQQAMLLVWDDFDLTRRMLRIRGELGKSRQERQGRIVPVSEHLVQELETWPDQTGWLIKSKRHRGGERERMARTRDMNRAWKRAGIRSEVWHRRPHHSFRKGLVTGLKKAGADTEAVEFLVGHTLAGQRGTYVDPDAHGLREAVKLIPPLQRVFKERYAGCVSDAYHGNTEDEKKGAKSKKPRALRAPGASEWYSQGESNPSFRRERPAS